MNMIALAEKGWIPDSLIRVGIRRLCEMRLRDERRLLRLHGTRFRSDRFDSLRASPIAVETLAANEQHYEGPTAFFQRVLGSHLKYSACYWGPGVFTLSEAEEAMLELYAERAGLEDGQQVLDLGCGWGSLSLWLAARHPQSTIVAVSNSNTQRAFIEQQAAERGLNNLTVITRDVNSLQLDQSFDRIVSVEMLEHVPQPQSIVQAVADLLKPGGVAVFSTINQSRKAHLQMITLAEDVLRWVPKGTHDSAKFIRPSQLMRYCENAGLTLRECRGLSYLPIKGFYLSRDVSVNYFVVAQKAPV